MFKKRSIITIVGPTASGKSALAIDLAKRYNGEIIAADSRTIYKGMDIGTAKPTLQERQQAPHFGIDLVEPDKNFSAAEFKRYANNVVKNIYKRNKLPLIVGGTGLYIDGFIYDFEFIDKPNSDERGKLESLNLNELQSLAEQKNIDPGTVNFLNKRHLIRAIERGGVVGKRKQNLPSNILLIGLRVDKEQLYERIENRVDKMFEAGLVEEVKGLIQEYGANAPGLLAPGYKAVKEYLNENISLEEAKELFIRNDKNLAKRQMTWFKRNPDIKWCDTAEEADKLVQKFLAKF